MHASHITVSTTAVAVQPVTTCKQVSLREDAGDAGFPIANFTLQIPDLSAAAVQYPGGVERVIRCPGGGYFPAGSTVCYLAAVTGTMTFILEEEQ